MQAVTEAVTALHAYEVPESIAVQVAGGSEAYLAWVRQSTALGAAAATPAAAVSTSTATAAVGSLVTSTDGVGLEPHNVP